MSKQVAADFVLHAEREVPIMGFSSLEATGRFTHGITTRLGGVSSAPFHELNLSLSVGDCPEAVRENRSRAERAVSLHDSAPVRCRQVHGRQVVTIVGQDIPAPQAADALVTDRRGLALTMTFADCLPIILVDAAVPAVGLVHAGWRGTVAGVALAAWEAMQALGAGAESSTAYFGPSIGPCCYKVGADVVAPVLALGEAGSRSLEHRQGSTYLDLAHLNAQILEQRGIRTVQSHFCTACHRDLLYSHRAEGGRTGRFAVFVGMI